MVPEFLTILGWSVGVIGSGLSIYEFIIKRRVHWAVFAVIALAILIGSVVLTFLTTPNVPSKHVQAPAPTATVTMPPNPSPTATPTTPPPTPTSMPSPTPTTIPSPVPTELTPQPVGPETLTESTRLTCNCSDPIVVTITKIAVQPDLNRMLWSLTLENTGPNSATVSFAYIYLEPGDPNNPTSGGQEYYASGGAADNYVTLQPSGQPGAILTTTLTFSFVPYTMPYTLKSTLYPCP